MIKLSKNKAGIADVTVRFLGGLLFLALVLFVILGLTAGGINWLTQIIMGLLGLNPGPDYYASPANFDRLNAEVKLLLEESGDYAYKIIPYTIGFKPTKLDGDPEPYVLVGFNKDKDANSCINEKFEPPDKCAKDDRACLCMCVDPDGCAAENCVEYGQVDYFISDTEQNHHGGKMDGILDPKHPIGLEAHCLEIWGASGRNNWGGRNVLVDVTEADGKVFVFVAMVDDLTESRAKLTCFEQVNEFECAAAEDSSGKGCEPQIKLGHIFECKDCPDDCEVKDYDIDWLKAWDPCGCKKTYQREYSCEDFGLDPDACTFGKLTSGDKCVPSYDFFGMDMCHDCPSDCTLGDYQKDWLVAIDPCDCGTRRGRPFCAEFDDKYECALGDAQDGKCYPDFNVLGFTKCFACPKTVKWEIYEKDWVIAMDPCIFVKKTTARECKAPGVTTTTKSECCSGEYIYNERMERYICI